MAKSVRRKKQDRRQREHRTAADARRREREALRAAAVARATELLKSLRSPETPVAEVANAIVELWEQNPPVISMLGTVVEGEPERLEAVAAAVSQISPGSFGSQVMAIELAGLVRGDVKAASKMIDGLLGGLTGRGEARRRVVLGHRMLALGESLRAFRIAQAELAALTAATEPAGTTDGNGGDGSEVFDDAEMAMEAALGLQQAAVADAAGTDNRDGKATIAAFTDRGALTRLDMAIASWLDGQADADLEWWEEDLAELLRDGADDAVPREAVRSIMRCVGLVQPHPDDDADDSDLDIDDLDDDDESRPSLMSRFTADPATPAELAALAERWHVTIHFGLWRVDDSVGDDTGAELVDLVSKVKRYVPAASLGDRPPARWSVLLGALVCVDGVWRAASPMMPLSPVEGDALTELVNDAADVVVGALAGRRRRTPAHPRRAPFGTAQPHGVLVEDADPAPPFLSSILSTVVAMLVTDMVVEVAEYRSAAPRLRNTDGDPLVMVRAALTVDDPDSTVAKLKAHPDITVDEETGELCWWGRALTPAELATSVAQLTAQTGLEPDLDDGYVQRWLRGRATVDGTVLRLEVNSQQRLERFRDLLRDFGADPRIVERTTVDPEQDMVLPRGPLLPAPRAPEVDAAWAKHWLDEKVPALRGRTPRQAAGSDRDRPLLESLLRKFEWDDDMRAQSDHGQRSGTLEWIREQLRLAG